MPIAIPTKKTTTNTDRIVKLSVSGTLGLHMCSGTMPALGARNAARGTTASAANVSPKARPRLPGPDPVRVSFHPSQAPNTGTSHTIPTSEWLNGLSPRLNRAGDQPCNSPTRRSNVTASVITAGTRISFPIRLASWLTVRSHPGRGQRALERSPRDVDHTLVVLESQVVDRDTATERPPAGRGGGGKAVERLEAVGAVGALRLVEHRVDVRPASSLGVLFADEEEHTLPAPDGEGEGYVEAVPPDRHAPGAGHGEAVRFSHPGEKRNRQCGRAQRRRPPRRR